MANLAVEFSNIATDMDTQQSSVFSAVKNAKADFKSMADNLQTQTQADIKIGTDSKALSAVTQNLKSVLKST